MDRHRGRALGPGGETGASGCAGSHGMCLLSEALEFIFPLMDITKQLGANRNAWWCDMSADSGLTGRENVAALPTLEDVFRDAGGSGLDDHSGGGFRDVRSTRRTARRVG